ncbi:uncharacterized protein LOC115744044 [Rhodamnia argentea]|uniref:Uncharacterized protein LOC115744044 n=1 Tax=Rhodamnia argentea TaxID=178133 RepID=A0A8B8PKS6_9MYRT|nr:uncharacterized protein LOC115744044 [Rhodamnia argentea]
MVEFGDELVLESLRIPWLIWIQLLVMFLLLLLLYSFTSSFPSSADSSSSSAAAAAAPSSSSSPSSSSPPLDSRGSHSHKPFLVPSAHQVRESQSVKGFIATSTSRRVDGEEDMMEGENSSHSYMDHHPCSLVRLARIAFLKCLGLDFTSENSSFKRHRR